MTPPPARKGRPSAISSIGLTGAPSAAASVASSSASPQVDNVRRHDVTTSGPRDASTSISHDVATSKHLDVQASSQRNVAPAAGDGSVAFTLRLTADEAIDLDELQLEFRRTLRRRVDKAAIFRALLVLAAADPDLRQRMADQIS